MGGRNSYESTKRYQDKVYERISLVVRKGERETIKAAAEARGMSVNKFILEAIAEKMGHGEQK